MKLSGGLRRLAAVATESPQRRRILEHALRLVRARGAAAVTMRGLADELSLSPASLYLYFPGKEELLRQVATEGTRPLLRELREATAGEADARAAWRRFVGELLAFARSEPALDALAFDGASDAAQSEASEELGKLLAERLHCCAAAGALRVEDRDTAHAFAWSLLRAAARRARAARPTAAPEPERLAEAAAALFLRG